MLTWRMLRRGYGLDKDCRKQLNYTKNQLTVKISHAGARCYQPYREVIDQGPVEDATKPQTEKDNQKEFAIPL